MARTNDPRLGHFLGHLFNGILLVDQVLVVGPDVNRGGPLVQGNPVIMLAARR